MYSLKELTDNVVNGLDELFNVNIKHFCVTYSEKWMFNEACYKYK